MYLPLQIHLLKHPVMMDYFRELDICCRMLCVVLTSEIHTHTESPESFLFVMYMLIRVLQMTNPAIQNDFSYYRRTLSRMRINNTPVS